VLVPKENMILGEGRGFEIAQGRLGPGRIHHCMRLVGLAQRALEVMCERAQQRKTFGRYLAEQQSVLDTLALSQCDIAQARLLTLEAARQIDTVGNKAARDMVSAIKIVVPKMACRVLDNAIQLFGAAGLSSDHFLAEAYNYARQIRIADGPDEVHQRSLGRRMLKQWAPTQEVSQ